MDDLALLGLERDALWVTDAAGRLLHCRTPAAEPPPLVAAAAGADGIVWAASTRVPDEVLAALAPLLDAWTGDRAPDQHAAILEVLRQIGALAPEHGGPSYVLPGALAIPAGVDVRTSVDTTGGWLQGRMPEPDRSSLPAPWAVAVVDGEVAAVCETARSAPASVEAGVWTYEPHRRRGLAAAVTAAWSHLVVDRVAFYSTSWDNIGSQGVARRLDLRPLGRWWQVSAAS